MLENGAGQGIARTIAAFVGDNLGSGETPRTRDDFIGIGTAIRAHDQRHKNAARTNGRKNVRHVRRFLRVAHIGFADRQLAKVDKLEFHWSAPMSAGPLFFPGWRTGLRSEEHTSELQSLMRISYAVFCLKKKK